MGEATTNYRHDYSDRGCNEYPSSMGDSDFVSWIFDTNGCTLGELFEYRQHSHGKYERHWYGDLAFFCRADRRELHHNGVRMVGHRLYQCHGISHQPHRPTERDPYGRMDRNTHRHRLDVGECND